MIESLRLSLQGEHARSIEIVREGLAMRPTPDPEAKFYLARQLARDGAPADALTTIHGLVTEGFSCSKVMQSDPWLEALRGMPDFQGVLDEVLTREAAARAAFQAANGDQVLS